MYVSIVQIHRAILVTAKTIWQRSKQQAYNASHTLSGV